MSNTCCNDCLYFYHHDGESVNIPKGAKLTPGGLLKLRETTEPALFCLNTKRSPARLKSNRAFRIVAPGWCRGKK